LDVGSSFLPSEINAAFLCAQLERADTIGARRLAIWARYHEALAPLEASGVVRRPIVPVNCAHNAHMYYVLLTEPEQRTELLSYLNDRGISAVSHYVPLHSSPGGRRFGRTSGSLTITERVAAQLIRLPLWADMTDGDVRMVTSAIHEWALSVC
jgi:dTDP-4-amino-4,6-dideoxygalactose transaminase